MPPMAYLFDLYMKHCATHIRSRAYSDLMQKEKLSTGRQRNDG